MRCSTPTYGFTITNCLATRRLDMTVSLHLCRGNFRHSIHFSEGRYDDIAAKLFNEASVDCHYLEYDTERAGGFRFSRSYYCQDVKIMLWTAHQENHPLQESSQRFNERNVAIFPQDPTALRMLLPHDNDTQLRGTVRAYGLCRVCVI
ncbi:hypothetical protein BS17DRAFT_160309 [Gyrodon lividus]|nr:hypothetical protein BS17DRAFT_160309 [Gyrodon lividus]